ncbi:MAG: right-handed parallel beta-helix repeat-containing protein [Flavobacteriales bacterium]|nr:right-handed parallel beta-helix repeat-containing protein [Flavobacteriales bacterium]
MHSSRLIFLACLTSLLALLSVMTSSCGKDPILLDPSVRVDFSADTIWFDTVFTTIGSATQAIRLVNNNPGRILIESVRLERGEDSQFRINVDGIPGPRIDNLEIAEGDSVWLFAEVTVNPQDQSTPFILEEQIMLTVNGFNQYVELIAWGQDAIFHGGPGQIHTLPCDAQWSAEKPHVIYGVVGVGEGCSLTIYPDVQVRIHSGGGIFIDRGYLNVQGELGHEIVFEGDRLEPGYANNPGQWGIQVDTLIETEIGLTQASILGGGIWLYGSPGSIISRAILRNGSIGIQVDTTGSTTTPALTIENTVIHNMSGIGLLAQGASVSGTNNLFYDCAQACAAFTLGGRYRFTHSTFANYWAEGSRSAPSVYINDHYEDFEGQLQIRPLVESQFLNCLMWGNNATLDGFDELIVDLEGDENALLIRNCAVDMDQADGSLWLENTSVDVAPPFVSTLARDFHISSNSSIWNGGGVPADMPLLPWDLDGNARIVGSAPDMGCYERQ